MTATLTDNDTITSLAENIEQQLHEALLALTDLQSLLDADALQPQVLQFLLQYRLDTQDVVIALMQLEKQLLQQLGIDPLSNYGAHFDKLIQIIGLDDIRFLLNHLTKLLDVLAKLITHKELSKKSNQQHQPRKDALRQMRQAKKPLQRALHNIKSLSAKLAFIYQHEGLGPVQNSIAALEGPISRFHQCVYKLVNKTADYLQHLSPMQQIHRLEQQLADKTPSYLELNRQHQQLFHPAQQMTTNPSLEAAAQKRRLAMIYAPELVK